MLQPTFSDQRTLFKAYDIRGEHSLFTPEFIEALSNVLAHYYVHQAAASQIVIGFDARHGSEAIAQKLATCFRTFGVEVIWIGLVTTPIMAFWANQYQGHGLIATASHSEGHINGIKWLINGQSPSSEQIQYIYQQLVSHTEPDCSSMSNQINVDKARTASAQQPLAKLIKLPRKLIVESYIDKAIAAIETINNSQLKTTNPQSKAPKSIANGLKAPSLSLPVSDRTASPLKIVIDCLNGSTGLFAEEFFRSHPALCSQVIMLNATPDGNFPKGNPDPMENGRLQELSEAVIGYNADLGLSFDGDGDRLMVVDNQGEALVADHLLFLLARVAIEDHRTQGTCTYASLCTPTVIFDVKCSHHLPLLIKKLGAQGQMSKTGSSILRRALQAEKNGTEPHVLFAGELSGHFIFNDGHFLLHDDAMYAGLRLLNWLHYQPISLAEIVKTLPEAVSTPDVYLPLSDYSYSVSHNAAIPSSDETAQPILKKLSTLCDKLQSGINDLALSLPTDARLTCIDGLRLDFAHGFGIIRSSNTSNSLTVRFAGDSLSDLENIQGCFVNLCQSISQDLARQVANIRVKQ